MCYETSLTKKQKRLEEHFGAKMQLPELYEPYYHLSGFSHPNLFAISQENIKKIYPMQWGLVAPWGEKDIKGFRKKYNTLNAKSETILSSRMFRDSTINRRCLLLADGFFEPHQQQGQSIPYYCYLKDRALFAFAGIYNESQPDTYNCSIITTAANDFFSEIHNKKKRMPLVLDPSFYKEWLQEDLQESHIKEILNIGFIQEKFQAHPVSRALYDRSVNTNTPDILIGN